MRPADLVFWLDWLGDTGAEHGVLCQRHADSMVVPRDWTLDDLRDPELHLFRPPDPASVARPPLRRARSAVRSEQLSFDPSSGLVSVDGLPQHTAASLRAPAASVAASDPSVTTEPAATNGQLARESGSADEERDAPAPADPWRPDFDAADDLDGLLSADSPLLARAFRGTDRDR